MASAINTADSDHQTVKAWDDLYKQTDSTVWGNPAPFVVELINDLKPELRRTSRILDAGTGEGRHLSLLLSTGAHVYACDASENALNKLPPSIKDSVHTEICKLSRTPFNNDYFDLILMNDVFETLPDPGFVLNEMYRLLRPAGKLICNIPDDDDGVATDHMTPLPDGGYLYSERYYYRFWRPDDAIAVFAQHDFEILTNKTYTWQEGPHPTFRNEVHTHTSRVLVAQRKTERS